jgi:phage terminase large subunit-like protein
MACVGEADIEDGEVVYLGLDLSSTTDLTALIMVMAAHPARIRSFF